MCGRKQPGVDSIALLCEEKGKGNSRLALEDHSSRLPRGLSSGWFIMGQDNSGGMPQYRDWFNRHAQQQRSSTAGLQAWRHTKLASNALRLKKGGNSNVV